MEGPAFLSSFLSSGGDPLTSFMGEEGSHSRSAERTASGVAGILKAPVRPHVFVRWAMAGRGGTKRVQGDAAVDFACQLLVPLEVLDILGVFSGSWVALRCKSTGRSHAAWVVGVDDPVGALEDAIGVAVTASVGALSRFWLSPLLAFNVGATVGAELAITRLRRKVS